VISVHKRAFKCACTGGDSYVPPGFVLLTENAMMVVPVLAKQHKFRRSPAATVENQLSSYLIAV